MRRLTYENSRGDKIVFYLSPFLIESLEGIDGTEVDIQTQQSPYQDGSSYIDTMLQPRFIDLEGSIMNTDFVEIRKYRREISRACNPKLGLGLITLELDGDIKQIEGVVEDITFPERGQAPWQDFMLTWKCPNPYWKSPKVTEEPAFEPKFHFPFAGPFVMGVQRTDRVINNDGDAPMPIQVDFYGPAESPMIANETTGEFIRINKRLEENEVFKIDTTDGVKSVIYIDEEGNVENVFHWIDIDSTFFKLELGENEITCNCALSNNQKDFDIYYSKLYNAV